MNNESNKSGSDGLRILFPTLIYEAWMPDYAAHKSQFCSFNRQLRNLDIQGKQTSGTEYPQGYTSYFTRNNLYTEPVLAPLVQFLHDAAFRYAQQHHWDIVNFEPVMNTLWGNINPRFSFHRDHLHPYSHISGVFYVDIEPNSPAISFKDPRGGRWMMPPAADGSRPENTFFAKVMPQDGKLLMFPSWLEHAVEQNQTDFERISMSFNFEMRPKS